MRIQKIRNKINPADIGVSTEEFDKLSNGADLSDVYENPPEEKASSVEKTVVRLTENAGLADEKAYQKEHKLKAAHQILINGGSTAKIAELLKISLSEARGLRTELNARLINEVKTLDKNKLVGQSLMFYDSVQAKFLQMAQTDPLNPDKNLRSKIEALKGALQAHSDKNRFLKEVGMFREPINSGAEGDVHGDGANDLRDLAQMVISGEAYEIVDGNEEERDSVELLA